MRIRRIELHVVALAYSGGVYRLSGGREYTSFDAAVVHLVCDDGTEGWGESTPFGSTYIAAHPAGTRPASPCWPPRCWGGTRAAPTGSPT